MKPLDQQALLKKLTLATIVAATVVIILGAFTRLTDAGLGCPDWPTCYGHLWVPDSHAEIAIANNAFPDTPVLDGKTWPEQIHRITASSLGLLCLAMLIVVARQLPSKDWFKQTVLLGGLASLTIARAFIGDQVDGPLILSLLLYFASIFIAPASPHSKTLKLSLFIAGWVILQGLFGMWTVTLKLWPQVVTAHLLGGFTLISLLWWQLLTLSPKAAARAETSPHIGLDRSKPDPHRFLKTLAATSLIVVILQVFLGGWTSSNYAALACPDLPLCQGQLWPDPDFIKGFNLAQDIGPNYLGGTMDNASRVAVHLSHRIGAIIVSIILLVLSMALYLRSHIGLSVSLLVVLCMQVALGISNVAFYLPLPVAVLHNAGAALLVLTLITINYHLTKRASG